MARKRSSEPPEGPLYLAMPRDEAVQRINDRIELGKELKARPIRSEQECEDVQRAYWTWTEYNEEMFRHMFTKREIAEEYSASLGFAVLGGKRYLGQEIKSLHDSIETKIRRLVSISERLELIPPAPGLQPGVGRPAASSMAEAKVFVVHGRDEAARESVARFLEKLELTPVILHEQASQGRTVVEKLEHHGDVGYAVILLTPDDVGGLRGANLVPRARQNVVLELGYFLGRLGRSRVCALYQGEVEIPSDYMGVIYVPFDGGGAWRLSLAKELKAAGFSVDMNKAL